MSLGGSCKVAYEARAHFNFGEAYSFDWWISRADSIARYIKSPDPDALHHPDNLELLDNEHVSQVRTVTHDFRLHHEFPRDWDVARQPISAGWRETIAPSYQRHAALLKRFVDLNQPGRRILFIRTCEEEGDTDAIPLLLEALAERFSETEWRLLVVTPQADLNDERVLTAHFPLAELNWNGEASPEWKQAFEQLDITVLPGRKPFDRKASAEHH